MRRLFAAAVFLLAGCGSSDPGTTGSIKDVTVVLKGNRSPLPFNPRGSRITAVSREITELVGHPIVLELDTALSPELVASLEESVLASFETIARELVRMRADDPELFARAKTIARVVCTYDAVIRDAEGKVGADGAVAFVRSPPDRFPLLERGLLTSAVYFSHIAELDARWGAADPTKLTAGEREPWLTYMLQTRPGAGFLWVAARAKKGRSWEQLRAEHLERILSFASVAPADPRARKFLASNAAYVTPLKRSTDERLDPGTARRVFDTYEGWLVRTAPSFDDVERQDLLRGAFDEGSACRGNDCPKEALFTRFDLVGFALTIYDDWVREGARLDPLPGPRGDVFKQVLGPTAHRGEAETEIHFGKSRFFERALREEAQRKRLAAAILQRRDKRLLELALLNLGYQNGASGVAFAELLAGDAEMLRHALFVLFHDHNRNDSVKDALEEVAPGWWRDRPERRGFTLLVFARKYDHLHVHYGDNQWTRFVAEYGGPIPRDVLAAYLKEGPRAIEMAPKLWPALAKPGRDELIAESLSVLVARDSQDRTSRTRAMLGLLRTRLCEEKNAGGLAVMRAAIDRAATAHPDQKPALANALEDFQLARCAKPAEERRD